MEFSIITVCYNAITTIEKTILSVKNQSFEDYEHIIIDGGSTDGTLGVIDKYRDNFAVIISEPDNGIYDAMNKGISLSKGKFIAMLNADDFYLDNVLESVYLGIQRSGESVGVIYYGNLVVFNEKKEDGYVVKPLPLSQLANFMCLNHPTCFVSKDLYQMRYNIMYKSAADQDLFLRFVRSGARFIYLNSEITAMRKGGESSKFHSILEIWKVQTHNRICVLIRLKCIIINSLIYCILKMPFKSILQRWYKKFISNRHEKY